MKPEFWLERWRRGQLGWHQADFNPLLVKHWPRLELPQHSPVFVPLCGKSLDMIWLRRRGHPVYGVELAEAAVQSFFDENGIAFELAETQGDPPRFSGDGYRIYCGDYLEVGARELGACRGVYDRGALVALPPDSRSTYANHIQRVIPEGGQVLLVTLAYDQASVPGPPFSVREEDVHALYGERCRIERLGDIETDMVPPHFKAAGIAALTESAYRITKTRCRRDGSRRRAERPLQGGGVPCRCTETPNP